MAYYPVLTHLRNTRILSELHTPVLNLIPEFHFDTSVFSVFKCRSRRVLMAHSFIKHVGIIVRASFETVPEQTYFIGTGLHSQPLVTSSSTTTVNMAQSHITLL